MGRLHAGIQSRRANRYSVGSGYNDYVLEGVWAHVEDEESGGFVKQWVDEDRRRGEDYNFAGAR